MGSVTDMARPWLKLWTEIVFDPKLRRIPAQQRWCWIGCLCLAQDGRLELAGDPLTDRDIADACGVSMGTWSAARSYFLRAGMLELDGETLVICKWRKRQAPLDPTAAERMARMRQRQDDADVMDVTRNVTVGVTPDVTRNVTANVTRRLQTTEDRVKQERLETERDNYYYPDAGEVVVGVSSFSAPSLDDYRLEIKRRFGDVSPEVEELLPSLAERGTPAQVVEALAMAKATKRKKTTDALYALGILKNWQVKKGNGSTDTNDPEWLRQRYGDTPDDAEARRKHYVPDGYEDLIEH